MNNTISLPGGLRQLRNQSSAQEPPWKKSDLGKVTMYLSDSGVPPELLRIARRRVALLSLIVAGVCVSYLLGFPLLSRIMPSGIPVGMIVTDSVGLILASLIVFGITRIRSIRPQALLDIALCFEVLVAFGIGWLRHCVTWEQSYSRDWSEVACPCMVERFCLSRE